MPISCLQSAFSKITRNNCSSDIPGTPKVHDIEIVFVWVCVCLFRLCRLFFLRVYGVPPAEGPKPRPVVAIPWAPPRTPPTACRRGRGRAAACGRAAPSASSTALAPPCSPRPGRPGGGEPRGPRPAPPLVLLFGGQNQGMVTAGWVVPNLRWAV